MYTDAAFSKSKCTCPRAQESLPAGDTWVVALQDDTYTPVTRWYTYYTALHWAFTQMCPGCIQHARTAHKSKSAAQSVLISAQLT
eukprot:3644952-Amphidinium_carterae.1